MQKIRAQSSVNRQAKQEFSGKTPNLFVGRVGYPRINVGFLSTEQYDNQDNPKEWVEKNRGIQEIIDYRTQLINSTTKATITSFKEKYVQMAQEVAIASKPADIEVELSKKPAFTLSMHQIASPHGPNVELKKARFTENVKIDHRIERVVQDDLLATEQISQLSNKVDEHELTKMFSAGLFGRDPKLVPTRWSITAVDDTLGKQMIGEIKGYGVGEYELYMGSYLGNYYLVLCFPEGWRYELFETIVGEKVSFSTDYESHRGRTNYAESTAGGYYAARLAILERLKQNKKQQGVLALRFITDEYWAPLGVWVVREATRKAMRSQPLIFEDKQTMLKYVVAFAKKKFGMEAQKFFSVSKMLTQPTLEQF